MANVTHFIDVYRDAIVALPEFIAVNLQKKDVLLRYDPHVKTRRPEDYPVIELVYDFNNRERWAAIDNVNLTIRIEMKDFDDTRVLAEAIRNKFHEFKYSDDCVTVYKSFLNGGDGQPLFNKENQTYIVILVFEIALG